MNFSTKKRPRKEGQAWRELQRELDERERLEEENAEKFARLDQLRARTAPSTGASRADMLRAARVAFRSLLRDEMVDEMVQVRS